MKKILIFTLSIILAVTALTGCGKSAEELNDIAETMLKAGCNALTNLEDDDASFGKYSLFYLDSEGETFGYYSPKDEEREDFVKEYKTFFKDLDKYYWIAGIEDYKVTEMYVAESEKSEIIGAYKNNFDVEEKSVSDLKNEISDWGKDNVLQNRARLMFVAGNNAFIDLDDDGISFGDGSAFYLDSTGEIFGTYDGKNKDKFVEKFKAYFKFLDEYYWVVGINGYEIAEIYIAESEDSDTVYAYGSELDVSDKSVSDLKDLLLLWDLQQKIN